MDLTDEQWRVLEPLVGQMPRRAHLSQPPRLPNKVSHGWVLPSKHLIWSAVATSCAWPGQRLTVPRNS